MTDAQNKEESRNRATIRENEAREDKSSKRNESERKRKNGTKIVSIPAKSRQ